MNFLIAAAVINITLVVFCCVRDPQWQAALSAPDYQAIQAQGLSPDCIPAKLGYKGFLVQDALGERLIVGTDVQRIHLQQHLLQTMPSGLIPDDLRQRVSNEIGNVSADCGVVTRRKRLAPPFGPFVWNHPTLTRRNNNCYNYANIKITNTYAQPGRGGNQMFIQLTGLDVSFAAIRDGLQILIPQPGAGAPVPGPPAGQQHLVALFVDPG